MTVFIKGFFQKLSIRHKFLIAFSLTGFLTLSLGTGVAYHVVNNTLEEKIESELEDTTSTVVKMVKSASYLSIKNTLRAVAEKKQNMVREYYKQYKRGRISERVAKKRAARELLREKVGKSGYVYCLNSAGSIKVHPDKDLIDQNFIDHAFIREQMAKKKGFIEYKWANQDDVESRAKALYMVYFKEWDWIISATSYREEFTKFINIDDFYPYIRTISVGKTGFIFIMNSKGTLIVHPYLQGRNIYDAKDKSGRRFIKEICSKKNGSISYPWKKPWEKKFREKTGIYRYIPELDWIVVSSGYIDELYRPLRIITITIITTGTALLVIVLLISLGLGHEISKPLNNLIKGLEAGAEGDYSTRIEDSGKDEFKKVRNYFNIFMDALSSKVSELENRNKENSLLRQMSEKIQSCNSKDEIYDVTSSFMKKFFPEEQGGFYLLDSDSDLFKPVVSWNSDRGKIKNIEAVSCKALMQKKSCKSKNGDHDPVCKDCDSQKEGTTLCMPMVAQDKITGLFVQNYSAKNSVNGNGESYDQRIHDLVLIIVEHLSLALTNIELREKLQMQAIVDPLTGLYNRRYLDNRLKEESGRRTRHHFPVGVLMLDVDHFKIFNDTYGHECGDVVLKELGNLLKKNVRVEDILCRYGGEEFIVILIRSSYESTCKKAEELCSLIRNDLKIVHQGEDLSVTVSIGVASCPEHDTDIAKAILLADSMLYEAKEAGRDRVAVLPKDCSFAVI